MTRFIIAFTLALCLAAGASAETRTWLRVGTESAAQDAESRTAHFGDILYAEPVRYASAVQLTQNYAPHDHHPDRKVAAGTNLFRVDHPQGAYFCSTLQLRDMELLDVPGVALGSAIFGGDSQRGRPREILWQCFRDTNNDGAFDRVGGGAYHATTTLDTINDIRDFRNLEHPVRYEAVEAPALRDDQQLYLGLRFQRLDRVNNGVRRAIVMCYGLGPQLGACNPIGIWLLGTARAPTPFDINALHARIVVEGIEGDTAAATLHYRVERGFQPTRFSIDSESEVRAIPADARNPALAAGTRSYILFRTP